MKNTSLLIAALLVGFVAADIIASRTVDSVEQGTYGTVVLDSGCTDKDDYGSNNCDLKWGQSYNAIVNITTGEVLESNSTITIDLEIKELFKIPFKASCPICGVNCTITIPIIEKKESIAMPACPIAGALDLTKTFTMPPKFPIPFKASASGTVVITNGNGDTVAHLTVKGSASK
mmetsp:Transcript_25887/g.62365  ORF Transcript_25887/g.62365 Transcript_25887/m.62365 type:complete len:175 (+) Transcript_25887:51-575(+)|eukprot:CAMPEP_0114497332 /NCGR_PEP_ID=MMETSP0109-20121206/6264_1 /TAXON_ID=29199 /ORGANISM="Chlorarachnion reptans, Strain CCCM449" /LENGTH=174 /DNA_ID=CAMNT_0001674699 /DNA_START=47 /DNA_END=571 /DNA_ORIENTATION=+